MSDTTIRIKRIPQEQSVSVSTESEHTISVDGEVQEQVISVDNELIEQTIDVETVGGEQSISVQSEAISIGGVDPYTGSYSATPSTETQTLYTNGLRMTANVTINPIPSNYGLITYSGSVLTVS